MRLFVASVVFVLLSLSFPGIVSKLEKTFNKCGDFILNKISPVIPGILENSALKDRYKIICQKYKNKIRFVTLYDTENKIPVLSAYKYTGTTKFRRPKVPWMIESQLEPPSDDKMRVPFVKQARNGDYLIKNPYNCTPGALFPMNHAADRETAESTLTLTNNVPLNKDFREGLWNLVENKTKRYMDSNCTDNNKKNIVAYVLTGVVPGNEKLNDRVNIPSHVWTAFCCKNKAQRSWVSQTYWANSSLYNENITLRSLKELQKFLNETFGENVKLFNNCG